MLLLAAALTAAAPALPATDSPEKCRRTAPYYAYRIGKPLKPQKLTELPPGTTYMAVLRHIGPCEAPLTMTEDRNPRR